MYKTRGGLGRCCLARAVAAAKPYVRLHVSAPPLAAPYPCALEFHPFATLAGPTKTTIWLLRSRLGPTGKTDGIQGDCPCLRRFGLTESL